MAVPLHTNSRSHRIRREAAVALALIVAGQMTVYSDSSQAASASAPLATVPYSFCRAPFVNPRIIETLNGWASDEAQCVLEVDLTAAQNSNQFFLDAMPTVGPGFPPSVTYRPKSESDVESVNSFGYRYVGKTEAGIHILETWEDPEPGSACWVGLLFLIVQRGAMLVSHQTEKYDETYSVSRSEILLRTVGHHHLGDRFEGTYEIDGNRIKVFPSAFWSEWQQLSADCADGYDLILDVSTQILFPPGCDQLELPGCDGSR